MERYIFMEDPYYPGGPINRSDQSYLDRDRGVDSVPEVEPSQAWNGGDLIEEISLNRLLSPIGERETETAYHYYPRINNSRLLCSISQGFREMGNFA